MAPSSQNPTSYDDFDCAWAAVSRLYAHDVPGALAALSSISRPDVLQGVTVAAVAVDILRLVQELASARGDDYPIVETALGSRPGE